MGGEVELRPERDGIPDALRERDQWVAWATEERDDELTKVPIDPQTGRMASTTDPDTWSDFETAWEHYQSEGLAGIGFVFDRDGPFCGVDLDGCRDRDTGRIGGWAKAVIQTLDSYTEVSPSGTGLHVIVVGEVPPGGNRSGPVEMYDSARYFTVTGHGLDLTPDDINERPTQVAEVHDEHIGGEASEQTSLDDLGDDAEPDSEPDGDVEHDLSDDDVIERAKNASNGAKFRRLWSGDISGYPSHSEADLALCNLLAYWTGPHPNRIDTLFRQSGLCREKWLTRRDYRERTIERALDDRTDYYEPGSRSSGDQLSEEELAQLESDAESMARLLDTRYARQVAAVDNSERSHLYVEYSELADFNPELASRYRKRPQTMSNLWSEALASLGSFGRDPDEVTIRVTDTDGELDALDVTDLNSEHLGRFVAVEGQLSKVTGINFRVLEGAFECARCGGFEHVPQPSLTSFQKPHSCRTCDGDSGGPWTIDTRRSDIADQRKLKLETPPGDRAQGAGDDITVFALGDLCHYGGQHGLADRAGERVVVLGRLCSDGSADSGSEGEFAAYIIAESVVFVERDLSDITVEETREEFERLAAGDEGDPVELLKDSITTSVERTEQIDRVLEAGVAWLFNAYRLEGEGGDSFRGDLHMGVIGDPSTAKSTILANLARIAPKSVYRSGGSISKVGLTAAAVQEEFAGTTEWTLEPGVLPRANGGHCLIDEVDEILDGRSKAIHDALEGEQLVKVDKAGISADLPTRTAVCVSGNPKEGRFDPYAPVADQLDMDPALVSRMDVLLPVTDTLDQEQDESIAHKIADSYEGLVSRERPEAADGELPDDDDSDRPVPIQVFRDWVHYARENVFPRLSEEAKEMLVDMYLEIRNLNGGYDGNPDAPIPATARVLEAGIRLSTAFARAELSETVETRHVDRTRDILKASIGMNFDSELAAFDVDGTGVAKPTSRRDREKMIRDIIAHREAEFENGVPTDVITEQAAELGADPDKVGHSIERMKRSGDLYEPSQDGRVLTT